MTTGGDQIPVCTSQISDSKLILTVSFSIDYFEKEIKELDWGTIINHPHPSFFSE